MSAKSIDNQILQYLPLLGNEEKKSLLAQIKSFISAKPTEQRRMSRDEFIIEYNKDIERAEKDIEQGLHTSQEDLEKESENW
jgi:hypothetical protein